MSDHRADYTQKPAAHDCPAGTEHDREVPEIDLLSPLTIRGGDAPQPDRDVPHVPVHRQGRVRERLAPGPPGQPGGRRGGPRPYFSSGHSGSVPAAGEYGPHLGPQGEAALPLVLR
jgi:hypothetical protein